MKIIEGLGDNQAILLGETMAVQLPTGLYLINGVEKSLSYNNNQVFINQGDTITKVKKGLKQVSHYEDSDGNTVSVEEFNKAHKVLSSYWDDDVDEYVFPDLDTEFKVRKEWEKYKALKSCYAESVTTYEEVVPEVIGTLEETGSDFIDTPFLYGKASWFQGQAASSGVYRLDLHSVYKNAFSKLAEENPEWVVDRANHSGMKYWKINNDYVFTNAGDDAFEKPICKYFKTLEEAVKAEKAASIRVKNLCYSMANKTLVTSGKVYSGLLRLDQLIKGLRVVKSSESDKRSANALISNLVKNLERTCKGDV